MIIIHRQPKRWLVKIPDDHELMDRFTSSVKGCQWDEELRLWFVPMIRTCQLFRWYNRETSQRVIRTPFEVVSPFVTLNRSRKCYEIRVRRNVALTKSFKSSGTIEYEYKRKCWICPLEAKKSLDIRLNLINKLGDVRE